MIFTEPITDNYVVTIVLHRDVKIKKSLQRLPEKYLFIVQRDIKGIS